MFKSLLEMVRNLKVDGVCSNGEVWGLGYNLVSYVWGCYYSCPPHPFLTQPKIKVTSGNGGKAHMIVLR